MLQRRIAHWYAALNWTIVWHGWVPLHLHGRVALHGRVTLHRCIMLHMCITLHRRIMLHRCIVGYLEFFRVDSSVCGLPAGWCIILQNFHGVLVDLLIVVDVGARVPNLFVMIYTVWFFIPNHVVMILHQLVVLHHYIGLTRVRNGAIGLCFHLSLSFWGKFLLQLEYRVVIDEHFEGASGFRDIQLLETFVLCIGCHKKSACIIAVENDFCVTASRVLSLENNDSLERTNHFHFAYLLGQALLHHPETHVFADH